MDKLKDVKYRTVMIPLSDDDCERIAVKAGSVGMTVGDLLAHFIGDLVCGTFTGGSDERMYADQWFDRCLFSMLTQNTFIGWLLHTKDYSGVEDFMGHYEIMKECEEDLQAEDPTDTEEANREEIAYQQNWMKSEYRDYCAYLERKGLGSPKSFEDAVSEVVQWDMQLHEMKRCYAIPLKEYGEGK